MEAWASGTNPTWSKPETTSASTIICPFSAWPRPRNTSQPLDAWKPRVVAWVAKMHQLCQHQANQPDIDTGGLIKCPETRSKSRFWVFYQFFLAQNVMKRPPAVPPAAQSL